MPGPSVTCGLGASYNNAGLDGVTCTLALARAVLVCTVQRPGHCTAAAALPVIVFSVQIHGASDMRLIMCERVRTGGQVSLARVNTSEGRAGTDLGIWAKYIYS